MVKRKIINDPVFGFITIPNNFLYNLIRHPYLQRLSRIKQLGLTSYVYPGAQHTRLHHSIGAMSLMNEAISVLRSKGCEITDSEATSALACILLHDVGHGPFSHVLERTLGAIHHEAISLLLMNKLNDEYDGAFSECISIFRNEHPKKYLHQLVSGQLDVDRLDYLRRDSFFTGVSEGNIGSDRIIKILDQRNGDLVVEAKGIYSIENFLLARRLMYWQVYLHKTAVVAETMMINVMKRAKELAMSGVNVFATPALAYFLNNEIGKELFVNDPRALECFIQLDDSDIWSSMKVWMTHEDKVLSLLSAGLVNRRLFKIESILEPHNEEPLKSKIAEYMQVLDLSEHEAGYLTAYNTISTNIYNEEDDRIRILFGDGTVKEISEASDMLDIDLLSKRVEKHYFSYFRL